MARKIIHFVSFFVFFAPIFLWLGSRVVSLLPHFFFEHAGGKFFAIFFYLAFLLLEAWILWQAKFRLLPSRKILKYAAALGYVVVFPFMLFSIWALFGYWETRITTCSSPLFVKNDFCIGKGRSFLRLNEHLLASVGETSEWINYGTKEQKACDDFREFDLVNCSNFQIPNQYKCFFCSSGYIGNQSEVLIIKGEKKSLEIYGYNVYLDLQTKNKFSNYFDLDNLLNKL